MMLSLSTSLFLFLQPMILYGVSEEVDIQKGSSSPSSHKSYSPSKITVDIGTSVKWINKDTTIHTVTSGKPSDNNEGEEFDSLYLAPEKSFEHSFEKSGTYNYYCTLHPFMKGRVIVSTNNGAINTAEKQPSVEVDTTGDSNINVTQWSNFTDADKKFSVQYPSHWFISQSGNRFTDELPLVAVDVNGSSSKIQSQLSVDVFEGGQSFDTDDLAKFARKDLVYDVSGNQLVEPINCDKYVINGEKACYFLYSGNDEQAKRYAVIAVVIVDGEEANHVISYRSDPLNFDREQPTIDHIIGSYRLLNPP